MANFKNRIIGYGEEPIDQILFNPANWRIHPKSQQDALTGVLEEVGWVQNVIVNKRTGHLVDGHLRVQLADRAGEKTIPVTYVDLSESEEMTVLATIDPIAALAATDKEKLDEVLRGVHADDARIQELIASVYESNIFDYTSGGDKRAGTSPWERMQNDGSEGILFAFGSVVCKLSIDIYDQFSAKIPQDRDAIKQYIECILCPR